ncbi:MAG TPA: FHA domain-containing protein, partial [bacterium]|nr:FHA domain-containing protein [bacterium]
SVLKVRLSLKGRPIRSFTFSQKEIVIGRDPESDIFLDNAGVSRNHARFELTPAGYMVEDLGSANGTYLNDELVTKKRVADDDIVRVGKFALWLNLGEDQRAKSAAEKRLSPSVNEGTVVLSNMQLDRMLNSMKANEEQAAFEPQEEFAPQVARSRATSEPANPKKIGWIVGAALAAGIAIGTLVAWILLTRTHA